MSSQKWLTWSRFNFYLFYSIWQFPIILFHNPQSVFSERTNQTYFNTTPPDITSTYPSYMFCKIFFAYFNHALTP